MTRSFKCWAALVLAGIAVLAVAPPAWGCAVCSFDGPSRWAFITTTAILTFVPLVFIGSVVGFLFWRYRRRLRPTSGNEVAQASSGQGASS